MHIVKCLDGGKIHMFTFFLQGFVGCFIFFPALKNYGRAKVNV